ncbi:uncharacterized protein LOC107263831 isoform X3 [Cephus cinctus]|uniref:Uncharacterized protein LOC107263831 isoform X3 n=1 Tax=Cephus cinctus TaxID=211228 RepID=A0AAJ7R9G6_CEPCN|nr:uncharacterized protein LOC107263831 isoform X3 [Cephus cinctus]
MKKFSIVGFEFTTVVVAAVLLMILLPETVHARPSGHTSGRRRRSNMESGLQKLQRILQAAAQESNSISEESVELPSSFLEDFGHQHEGETEDQFI